MRRIGGHAGKRIVGIYEPPVVERIAVVLKRIKLRGVGGVEIEPLAVAAIKVLSYL